MLGDFPNFHVFCLLVLFNKLNNRFDYNVCRLSLKFLRFCDLTHVNWWCLYILLRERENWSHVNLCCLDIHIGQSFSFSHLDIQCLLVHLNVLFNCSNVNSIRLTFDHLTLNDLAHVNWPSLLFNRILSESRPDMHCIRLTMCCREKLLWNRGFQFNCILFLHFKFNMLVHDAHQHFLIQVSLTDDVSWIFRKLFVY